MYCPLQWHWPFITSEKRKSISPREIQVKNQRETISTEEKLDVKSQLEKGEHTADVHCNARLTCISANKVCDNADRIKGSAKSGTKMFVCVARLPQSHQKELYQKLCESLTLFLYLK
jgi:hypothetical protein